MSAIRDLILTTVTLLCRVYIDCRASESMAWCARREICSSLRPSLKDRGSSTSPSIRLLQLSLYKLTIFSLFFAMNCYRRGAEQFLKVRDSTPEYIDSGFSTLPWAYTRSMLMLVGAIEVSFRCLGSVSSLWLRVKCLMWHLHSISSYDVCISSFVLYSVRLSDLLRK